MFWGERYFSKTFPDFVNEKCSIIGMRKEPYWGERVEDPKSGSSDWKSFKQIRFRYIIWVKVESYTCARLFNLEIAYRYFILNTVHTVCGSGYCQATIGNMGTEKVAFEKEEEIPWVKDTDYFTHVPKTVHKFNYPMQGIEITLNSHYDYLDRKPNYDCYLDSPFPFYCAYFQFGKTGCWYSCDCDVGFCNCITPLTYDDDDYYPRGKGLVNEELFEELRVIKEVHTEIVFETTEAIHKSFTIFPDDDNQDEKRQIPYNDRKYVNRKLTYQATPVAYNFRPRYHKDYMDSHKEEIEKEEAENKKNFERKLKKFLALDMYSKERTGCVMSVQTDGLVTDSQERIEHIEKFFTEEKEVYVAEDGSIIFNLRQQLSKGGKKNLNKKQRQKLKQTEINKEELYRWVVTFKTST